MADIVIPPELLPDDQEGILLGWLYASGATVAEGDVIAEVTVEKSQFEIEAPSGGTLTHLVDEEAILSCGQVIGTIS